MTSAGSCFTDPLTRDLHGLLSDILALESLGYRNSAERIAKGRNYGKEEINRHANPTINDEVRACPQDQKEGIIQ